MFPLLEREMDLRPIQLGLPGSAFAWVSGLYDANIFASVFDVVSRGFCVDLCSSVASGSQSAATDVAALSIQPCTHPRK